MTILQRSFMLRVPDEIVEKISIEEKFLDCAPYISKSGASFNGCLQERGGELVYVRGLYKLYGEPLFRFASRGKISRDIDAMKDLIGKFLREFAVIGGLVYFDNYSINVYDAYKKAILLEDTPVFTQGHLYIFRLRLSSVDLDGQTTTEEKVFNHRIVFSSAVNVKYNALDGLYVSPGYGIFIQNANDVTAKIASPDHGEAAVELPAGQWLFLHSPPRRNVD